MLGQALCSLDHGHSPVNGNNPQGSCAGAKAGPGPSSSVRTGNDTVPKNMYTKTKGSSGVFTVGLRPAQEAEPGGLKGSGTGLGLGTELGWQGLWALRVPECKPLPGLPG